MISAIFQENFVSFVTSRIQCKKKEKNFDLEIQDQDQFHGKFFIESKM